MQLPRLVTSSLVALCLLGGPTLRLVAAASSNEQAANPQSWRGTILQNNAIEIKGINGDIKATAASGQEVEVSAVMKGRRSNPAEVRLEVVQHSDGVTICAMYPSPDSRPNECAPGDGGRMNVRDNDVTVSFTVRVPPGVRFNGRMVNGDVSAEGLAAPVSVRSVNGDVSFSTTAYGDAQTVNGSIRGAMGSSDWNQTLTFKSVNGSISLDLPSEFSSDIDATTVNGSITTDFPITVTGKVNPRKLTGTIGSGGRTMDLETVNGSVTLKRR